MMISGLFVITSSILDTLSMYSFSILSHWASRGSNIYFSSMMRNGLPCDYISHRVKSVIWTLILYPKSLLGHWL